MADVQLLAIDSRFDGAARHAAREREEEEARQQLRDVPVPKLLPEPSNAEEKKKDFAVRKMQSFFRKLNAMMRYRLLKEISYQPPNVNAALDARDWSLPSEESFGHRRPLPLCAPIDDLKLHSVPFATLSFPQHSRVLPRPDFLLLPVPPCAAVTR